MASIIDLDRVRRNDDRLSTLQLILSGAVDLDALKEVLRVNTKVSEVIIYVDESFLVELPVEETHDLFRTIGGMPNLQKLGFHSQSGSSGVLSIQALIAITSHATRMVHFGISDVALWGSQADFQLWATQLQTQLFLQSFCVCECELLEPSKECPLDPLLTVLSILPSLEALFLQAATPNALGQVSPEAVGAIGMAPQLQDLRLGNFELKHKHMEQMAQVLPHNTVLTELKLDACHEFHVDTAHSMAKILKHNRRLKSIELGLTSMISDDCAVTLAKSLHYNTTLESFTLSRGANARFRPTISKACQQAFVEMLHQNYCLETLVLFQRFPVKKEFKLYLTLNKYGRGKLLMNHETKRENWIQAIHKVNDDLDSIFYYLSINPALCNNCFDDEEDEEEEVPEEAAAPVQQDPSYSLVCANLIYQNLAVPGMTPAAAAQANKRLRQEQQVQGSPSLGPANTYIGSVAQTASAVAESSYLTPAAKRLCTGGVGGSANTPSVLHQQAQQPILHHHQAQHSVLPASLAAAAALHQHASQLGGLSPQMALQAAVALQLQQAHPLLSQEFAAVAAAQLVQARQQQQQPQQIQVQDPPGAFYHIPGMPGPNFPF